MKSTSVISQVKLKYLAVKGEDKKQARIYDNNLMDKKAKYQ